MLPLFASQRRGAELYGRSRAFAVRLCTRTQHNELLWLVKPLLQGLLWSVTQSWMSAQQGAVVWWWRCSSDMSEEVQSLGDLSFAKDVKGTRSMLLGNWEKKWTITICLALEIWSLISSNLGKVEILVFCTQGKQELKSKVRFSKAFRTDLRLLPRNLTAVCPLISIEDAGQCQTFKKLCETFLSLLCLKQGGISSDKVTGPGSTAPGSGSTGPTACLCGTERSSGVTSSLKWRFPDLFLQGLDVLQSHPQ